VREAADSCGERYGHFPDTRRLTGRNVLAARDLCGVADGSQKLHGKERYCYESTSKQMKQRAADIIAKHANG